MTLWFRHFTWAAIVSYAIIRAVTYCRPEHMSLLVGEYGPGRIGRIALIVGAAWYSTHTIWRYARGRDVR